MHVGATRCASAKHTNAHACRMAPEAPVQRQCAVWPLTWSLPSCCPCSRLSCRNSRRPGTSVEAQDVQIGPGKQDFLHTLVGGRADTQPPVVLMPGYGAGVGFYFRCTPPAPRVMRPAGAAVPCHAALGPNHARPSPAVVVPFAVVDLHWGPVHAGLRSPWRAVPNSCCLFGRPLPLPPPPLALTGIPLHRAAPQELPEPVQPAACVCR